MSGQGEMAWIPLAEAVKVLSTLTKLSADAAATEIKGAYLRSRFQARGITAVGLRPEHSQLTQGMALLARMQSVSGNLEWSVWRQAYDWADDRVGAYRAVQLRESDVRELANSLGSTEPEPIATVGRPSMKAWFLSEHTRRISAGQAQREVKAEAKALRDWLEQEHPGLRNYPGLGTIENNIRLAHRAAHPRR